MQNSYPIYWVIRNPFVVVVPPEKEISFTIVPQKIAEVKKEHVKVKQLVSHSELSTAVEQNSVSIKKKLYR